MSELPHKLAKGEHKVIATAGRDNTLEEFKAAIDRAYVHVKFTETRGGTELGFRLDEEHTDLSGGDFANASGKVKVAGKLNLDGVDVRCEAEIDLKTLDGTGHLVILEPEEKDTEDEGSGEQETSAAAEPN
jgi:hypothetical protein